MRQGLPYHRLLQPWPTVILCIVANNYNCFCPNISATNLTSAAINKPNGTGALAQYGKVFNYTQCDYAVGLRNWLGSVVHSMSVDVNGTTVVQATSFIGMINCFNMITSFSYADFYGVGFYRILSRRESIGHFQWNPDRALFCYDTIPCYVAYNRRCCRGERKWCWEFE